MHVMVSKMTAVDHRAGNRSTYADHQVGKVVQAFAVPNSQMNVVMVNDLNSDAAEQTSRVHRPRESAAPLHNGKPDVQYDVSQ